MSDTMHIWNQVNQPPKSALKTISGGRLRGMTDINPQWRLQIMTEIFGPVGLGWRYTIDRLWTEPGANGETLSFALVSVSYKSGDIWSDPVPGIGGSTMVAKERSGLNSSDEAYKMAVTDALSVALKALGVAADIYAGKWDGSKYKDAETSQPEQRTPEQQTQLRDRLIALNAYLADDFLPSTGRDLISAAIDRGESDIAVLDELIYRAKQSTELARKKAQA